MKTKTLTSLFAIALAFIACNKNVPEPEPVFNPELKLDKTEKIAMPAEGGSVNLKVTANISWTAAVSNQNVATVSPAAKEITDKKSAETAVTVTVKPNEDLQARTATLTFKAEGCQDIVVNIEQAAAEVETVFEVFDNQGNPVTEPYQFAGTGDVVDLYVNANVSWTATASEGWLAADPASFEATSTEAEPIAVSISAAFNPSAEPRTATITFSADGVDPIVVTVNQDPYEEISFCDASIQPGNYYQDPTSNATNTMVLKVSGTDVDSFRFFFAGSEGSEELTDEQLIAIMEEYGEDFPAEYIEYINDGGINYSFTGCESETEYILIAQAVSSKGLVQNFIKRSSTLGDYIFKEYTVEDEYYTIPDKSLIYGKYYFLAKYTDDLSVDFPDREMMGTVEFADGGSGVDADGYDYDHVEVTGMWNTQFNSKYGLTNDVTVFDLYDGFLYSDDTTTDLGDLVEKASGTPVVTAFGTRSAFELSGYVYKLYGALAGAVIDESGTIAFFDSQIYYDEIDSEGDPFGPFLATLLWSSDPAQGGWYAAFRDYMFVPVAGATPATIAVAKSRAAKIQKEIHSMPRNYVELRDTRIERAIMNARPVERRVQYRPSNVKF